MKTVKITKQNIQEMVNVRDRALNRYKLYKRECDFNFYKKRRNEIEYVLIREKKRLFRIQIIISGTRKFLERPESDKYKNKT